MRSLSCRSIIILLLCSLLVAPNASFGEDAAVESGLSREQKALLLNAGSAGAILVWGAINWDYFSQKPRTHNEGWFGSSTKTAGADKVGHAYTAYLLSHTFSSLYRSWGYNDEEASRYGCYSSIGITGVMELGDALSKDFGFSYEDMLMNMVGAGFGFLTEHYPALGRKVNFRWEYRPSLSRFEEDFITDYDHSKYLVAVKADGFDPTPNWLKPFEFHFGYYARNDNLPSGRNHHDRMIYTAVGINLTRLIRPYYETSFFDYFQLPYVYLALEKNLD